MEEPLSEVDARDLARDILENGMVRFSKHARDQMKARGVSEQDVTNCVRGGHVKSGKGITFENGSWRYTIETQKTAVAIAFQDEETLTVVTVWRNDP